MPRYRKRETGRDEASRRAGPSDFLNVENRRRELFPEEFAEGAYGAPAPEAPAPEAPAGPLSAAEGAAPPSGSRRSTDRGAPRPG